jgi:hypothetical protein
LIVAGAGFYLLAMKLLKERTKNIQTQYISKILQIAYSYLFIIIVFGVVYFKIYVKDTNSFVITNGILQAKKANEIIETSYSQIKELNTKILLLNKLSENSEAAFPVFLRTKQYYENGKSIEDLDKTVPFLKINDINLKLYVKYLGDSTRNSLGILSISFDNYKQIFVDEATIPERENYITGLFFSNNLSDFRNNILKKITYYSSEISKLNKSLNAEIKRDKDIGLIDFIYFSSITTTTIGKKERNLSFGFPRKSFSKTGGKDMWTAKLKETGNHLQNTGCIMLVKQQNKAY